MSMRAGAPGLLLTLYLAATPAHATVVGVPPAGDRPITRASSSHVCCIATTCLLMLEVECDNQGGTWYPEWDSCDPNPCPEIRACCHGGICTLLSEDQCGDLDGQWLIASTVCTPSPCDDVAACCVGAVCLLRLKPECDLAGGSWHAGIGCGPHHDCTELRVCCVGLACYLAWPDECDALGGILAPALASCAPNPCQAPTEPPTWGSIKALYRE